MKFGYSVDGAILPDRQQGGIVVYPRLKNRPVDIAVRGKMASMIGNTANPGVIGSIIHSNLWAAC